MISCDVCDRKLNVTELLLTNFSIASDNEGNVIWIKCQQCPDNHLPEKTTQ